MQRPITRDCRSKEQGEKQQQPKLLGAKYDMTSDLGRNERGEPRKWGLYSSSLQESWRTVPKVCSKRCTCTLDGRWMDERNSKLSFND